jgi:lycopene beta-cyclase
MNGSSGVHDVLLVGGGLQNALIALLLLEARPSSSVCLVEQEPAVGGNHTWAFHAGDVPRRAQNVVDALVVHRWPGYDVLFPTLRREIDDPYAAITSERLRSVVERRFRQAPASTLLTGARVARLTGSQVTLSDGRVLSGRVVIDARGPERTEHDAGTGYQKFVGLELLVESHALARPILMDATVQQLDGLRFLYVLPLAPDRLLVEDTYFSTSPALDRDSVAARALSYARGMGLAVRGVVRREAGVLPMPIGQPPAPSGRSPLLAGYAGGWFHPATGYSFPVALRLAEFLAATPYEDWFGPGFERLVARHRTQFRFGTLLNRMLFSWFEPEARWNALERFYRMPEDTIRRFYALDTTSGDRLRILCGRPPRGLSLGAVLSGGAAS